MGVTVAAIKSFYCIDLLLRRYRHADGKANNLYVVYFISDLGIRISEKGFIDLFAYIHRKGLADKVDCLTPFLALIILYLFSNFLLLFFSVCVFCPTSRAKKKLIRRFLAQRNSIETEIQQKIV